MIILLINFVVHRHSSQGQQQIRNRGLLQIVFPVLNASCMNFLCNTIDPFKNVCFNIDWSKLRTVNYAFAAIKPSFLKRFWYAQLHYWSPAVYCKNLKLKTNNLELFLHTWDKFIGFPPARSTLTLIMDPISFCHLSWDDSSPPWSETNVL